MEYEGGSVCAQGQPSVRKVEREVMSVRWFYSMLCLFVALVVVGCGRHHAEKGGSVVPITNNPHENPYQRQRMHHL